MLKVELLSYHRNGHQVFANISFEVDFGTCLLVRGANGSGKTTLLRLLAGFIPVQKGNITLNEKTFMDNRDLLAENIEYISHSNAIKKQMTAWENLEFWNNVSRQITTLDPNNRFEDLMSINEFKNRLSMFCSFGQRRRVALSRLNTSDKKVWLLDEPTTSLDQNAIKKFYKMLENHCLGGGIAIIATHTAINIPKINTKSIKLKKTNNETQTNHVDPFLEGEW